MLIRAGNRRAHASSPRGAGLVLAIAATMAAALLSAPLRATAESGPPGTVVVSVAGDIACGTTVAAYNNGDGTATQCRQKYTGRLLAGSDAVWTLGDHVYPTSTTT